VNPDRPKQAGGEIPAIRSHQQEETMNHASIGQTVCTGRPKDLTGRLPKEIRTYQLLDQLQIPYERLDHEAVFTIQGCQQIDSLLHIEICKNLFLCNARKTQFYLLMMPGGKKFKTSALSGQIGSSRLSFAQPEYMEKFLDITPGSLSVLGLMNDTGNQVQLLIDEEVIEGHPYIGCHPCVNTSSLKISTDDILKKFLPYINHSYILVH